MANNSNLSRRAALQRAQEMEERAQRNKRIMGVGIGLAAVIVIVVLAIVIMQAVGNRTTVAEEQLTPPTATANHGIPVGGQLPSEDTPHLIVWEDFQCPACANAEAVFGTIISDLVDQGEITAEIRTATFMDREREDGPSFRAAVAAAAAAEVGHYDQFHLLAFQYQGTGYTDNVLRNDIPAAAGITGADLTRFQQLYNSRAFKDFVADASMKFETDAIQATPAYIVSGMRLNLGAIEGTPDALLQAINTAWEAGGKQIEDTPEPYQPR